MQVSPAFFSKMTAPAQEVSTHQNWVHVLRRVRLHPASSSAASMTRSLFQTISLVFDFSTLRVRLDVKCGRSPRTVSDTHHLRRGLGWRSFGAQTMKNCCLCLFMSMWRWVVVASWFSRSAGASRGDHQLVARLWRELSYAMCWSVRTRLLLQS